MLKKLSGFNYYKQIWLDEKKKLNLTRNYYSIIF